MDDTFGEHCILLAETKTADTHISTGGRQFTKQPYFRWIRPHILDAYRFAANSFNFGRWWWWRSMVTLVALYPNEINWNTKTNGKPWKINLGERTSHTFSSIRFYLFCGVCCWCVSFYVFHHHSIVRSGMMWIRQHAAYVWKNFVTLWCIVGEWVCVCVCVRLGVWVSSALCGDTVTYVARSI